MRGILVVLLIVLLAAGCAAPVGEEPVRESRAARTEAPEKENMQVALVESAPLPLPEEEILEAYQRALRVWGWFDLEPLPSAEEVSVINGKIYRKVDMEGLADMDDLRAYARSVFSQELTDWLLEGGNTPIQYRDINGSLYVAGERRAPDPGKGGVQIETEQVEEGVYFVDVVVDLLDENGKNVVGLESWSFPYIFQDDRWVFTDFRLVY